MKNNDAPLRTNGAISSLSASGRRRAAALVVVLATAYASLSYADGLYQWEEYGSSATSAQKVSALSDGAFGDHISLFTGSVGFAVTDISVSGNSRLPVALSRRFAVESRNQGIHPNVEIHSLKGFFDWDVEVPYLEGTFSETYGWQTHQGGTPTLSRCSIRSEPWVGTVTSADNVWSGYNVHIPGGMDEKLLWAIYPGAYSSPTDGHTYGWVTKSNMRLRCLAGTANGYPGEGFVGITSDGTRYFFNWGIERTAPMLKVPGARPISFVNRKRVYLLATRMEDRFGNWVNFSYNGDQLASITANDGRSITLSWTNGRITSATTNGRTWQYQYQENATGVDGGLSAVFLPDGSRWSYAKTGRLRTRAEFDPPEGEECDVWAGGSYGPFTYSVTHPSGALAVFNFTQKLIYRVPEPSPCLGVQPSYYDVWGLDSKTVSGPGVPAQTTSYNVEEGPGPVVTSTSKWTTVTRPDGTQRRFRHGTDYATNEGKLLQEQTLTGTGTVIQDRSVSYIADSEVSPFPGNIGQSPHVWQADETRVRPLKSTSVALDGATFTTTVNSFDTMARAVNVTRSSSLGFSRTDVTAYQDHTAKWVLGLVTSVTNSNTGLVESQTTYDPTNAVPTEGYAFGKKRQTLAYYSDGTVQTVKDGANHTTTLSNWKRGIPQSILHANGTTQAAVVNDNGWITSVTDQNNFTTSYGYDSMGRLNSITYPAADDVVWNSSSQTFEQVASAEYGIPAGHWRKTESTGNARKITYFDALLRPVVTTEYDFANAGATQRFQRFRYDHANRVTFTSYPGTTDALTTGMHTQYDALGRTTSVSQDSELGSLVTRTDYLSGFQVRVTNPRNHVTLTGYRAYDEPTYELPAWIQHPEGAYTDIARDLFGKPTSITRRNADSSKSVTRRYVYDAHQQLCKTIDPETGATVADYDDAGNLSWSASGLNLPSTSSCDRTSAQSSGRTVSRTYDALNRIDTLAFPDSNGNQTWAYTPDGLPDTITTLNDEGASTVTNHYEYNKRRLLKAETLTQPGSSAWTTSYGYDANGYPSTVTYPSLVSVDYAPNALGQPTRAGGYATSVSYYPNGAIHQFTYGNGIVHTMTQNARQLPERVVDSGNVIDNTYTYDANTNVQNISDAIAGNSPRAMTYDGLDRLTETVSAAFGGDGRMKFTYDELDNLRSAKLAGVKQYNYGYEVGTNRLNSITNDGGNSLFGLSYDPQGNVSGKNAQGFTFDYGNRLREADFNGSLVERYRYDGYGRRVNAWSPSNGHILSMYGTDGVLRHQRDERTAKSIDYIYLGGSLISRVSTTVAPGAPYLTTTPSGFVTGGSYTVQWTPRAGATSYDLQERLNGSAWQTLYSGSATNQSMSSKPSGAYGYQVRACGAAGCSGWSPIVSLSVASPPFSAPTITVPATGINGSYMVSWTTVSDANTYTLEESANGGAWTSVFNGAGNSQGFSGKSAGTYSYRVKACNPNGCGGYSSTGSVQVIYAPSSAPTVSAPSQSTTGNYTVSWTAVSTATSYRLEESANGGAWGEIQNSASTSMGLSGKATGTYSYRARACNAAGCGPYSGTASTQVILPPTGSPTLAVPSSSNTGSYTVSWTSVAAATSYRLEESANGGGWTEIQNSASTSIALSGKGNGSYSYRARGCNAGGCGPYSAAQTIVVALPPPMPAWLSVTYLPQGGNYRFTATWASSAGATSYQLFGRSYDGPNTTFSWTLPQQAADLSIEYYVRACNANGCSDLRGPVYAQ